MNTNANTPNTPTKYYDKYIAGKGWCVVTSAALTVTDEDIFCVVRDHPGSHYQAAAHDAIRIADAMNARSVSLAALAHITGLAVQFGPHDIHEWVQYQNAMKVVKLLERMLK